MRISNLLKILLIILCLCPVGAGAATLKQQRHDYREALRALERGDLARHRQLRDGLGGYILQGHLDYAYLKSRVTTVSTHRIKQFLAANSNAVTSQQLRRKWLMHLANRGQWQLFHEEFPAGERHVELRCYRLANLARDARTHAQIEDEVKSLWLSGISRPDACDPLFDAWHKSGRLSSQLVWSRISLAMKRGRLGLASFLAQNYLSASDRAWVERWKRMHRKPGNKLRTIDYPLDSSVARTIVKHGVLRLGRVDPRVAMAQWQRLKKKHRLPAKDDAYIMRKLGIMAARRHLPEAKDWLASVKAEADDDVLRQWHTRSALRHKDWRTAKQLLVRSQLRDSNSQTRYLAARVFEHMGDKGRARQLFEVLADERGYYGFLAADRINRPYRMKNEKIGASGSEIAAMNDAPSIKIARELFTLGETIAARRQWQWATRTMTTRELEVAARVAYEWGWYDRAILTAGKSGHRDDLNLRFPVLYQDLVNSNAQRERLDPAWVFGLMRQESAFIADARSHAGALGLMQLMPATGRNVGRRLKLNIRNNYSILNVKNNIRLGTNYLRTVLEENGGHQVLATAAYNAGPHRVRKWLPKASTLPADLWVETIPFNETRQYVKNVMGFTTIYNHKLGKQTKRLKERMPPVVPSASRKHAAANGDTAHGADLSSLQPKTDSRHL